MPTPRPSAIDFRFPRHIRHASWTEPQVVSRIGTPRCVAWRRADSPGPSSRSYETRVSADWMGHRNANRRRTSPSSIVASHARPSGGRMQVSPPNLKLPRSEEHTSELQSLTNLVCRLLLEKKKNKQKTPHRVHNKTKLLDQNSMHIVTR